MSTKKTATKKAATKVGYRVDDRPTMSRMEMEQRVAGAGHAAVQKASKAGASNKLVRALAKGARKEIIGGLEIAAPALNSMVALDRYWDSELSKRATVIMALVYTVYAYLNPDDALVKLAESEDAFHAAAVEFSKKVDMTELKRIANAVKGHIGDLFGTGGAAEEAQPGEPQRKS